ncbi:MAG: alpha-galactosidase [Chitinophagaceae bacterium]|nr:MAG: alpha-galactosidase [Chitinophagaceae bacterium]
MYKKTGRYMRHVHVLSMIQKSFFFAFLFMLTGCSSLLLAQKEQSYSMELGSDSRIIYNLQKGTYSITWHDRQLVKDAYMVCNTNETIDSRSAGRASIKVSNVKTPLGKATLYTVSFADRQNVQQLFYVYASTNYFITQIRISGSEAAGYMAPLVADNLELNEPGDNRSLYVPFDNDMWARFNAAPLAEANFNSSEVTAIYNAGSHKGIVIGSLEQDIWKSGIRVKGKNANSLSGITAFAGFSDSMVTHDKIPHGKVQPIKGMVYSPQILVGYFSDWRDGMETFAKLNGRLHPRKLFNWNRPTPMGWNSWGVLRDKITFENAMGVVDFFADSCKNFRTTDNTLFIDLDAFWDNMTPGGLDGDVSKLKTFVAQCKAKGLKPGIYWTPFADWGKSDRPVEGDKDGFSYRQTWTTQNGKMLDIDGGRAMDPTHPATQHRMVHTITKMKSLGFEMIKIDFLGHGAQEADKFYDPAVTTGMQAFNKGMALLDSVLGKQMLVYAAISPTLATAGYVHVRRIACDAFSSLDNTEYTLNSTGYGWWQSHLYNYMDADHVVFGDEADGVNRARLAAALVTGTIITGDDYSSKGKWTATAKKLLQNKDLLAVVKDGKSFRPLKANTGNRGVELFTKKAGKDIYVAFFNYSTNSTTTLPPVDLLPGKQKKWILKELFSGETITQTGRLEIAVPPQDVRIYRISVAK